MKTLLIVFLSLIIVVGVFATGQPEATQTTQPITLTFLHSGDEKYPDGTTWHGMAIAALQKEYPNVTVDQVKIDLSTGAPVTMATMNAAGTPPDVIQDTEVRLTAAMVPDYAIALNDYIDVSKFDPAALAIYYSNGKLYGLPTPGGAQAMAVNLDIMKDIGYTIPANWTIDDFFKMAQLVKEKYNGKKYATGLFAGNQSGDYLMNEWFASFGVQFYQNKNYNHSTIAETGGAKVYQFFQTLVKNGYVHPDPATSVDDDYVIWWADETIAMGAFFPAWVKPYFDTVKSQGKGDGFNYEFVPFPRAPGVSKVPVYYSTSVLVAHKTGTAKDKISARFVELLNSAEIQLKKAENVNTIPNRTDVSAALDPHVRQVMDVVKDNGIMDVGLSDPRFTERRSLQFPILQKVLNLQIDPQTAIEQYAKALDGVK